MVKGIQFSFPGIIEHLGSIFNSIPDWRQPNGTDYSLCDALMGGFACMYMQHSSFLNFQNELKEKNGQCNLETLFRVKVVPKTNQLKDIINKIEPFHLQKATVDIITSLDCDCKLDGYKAFDGKYNLTLDGVQYFHSEKINCRCCLVKKTKDKTFYYHSVVQAAICKPGKKEVFPVYAEEIRNTDGESKQDCETNAAKRLLPSLKENYPNFNFIINGDDLYSRKPMIELVLSHGYNYIFVVKPDSHKYMMNYIEERYPSISTVTEEREKKKYYYTYMKDVPLNGDKNSQMVNFFSVQVIENKNGNEKIIYSNSWITDMEVTNGNIEELVNLARARWKIENECFNNLKNRGYHLEHNFGHGEKLSFNTYLLMLLAFLTHQILEIVDQLYQSARVFVVSKQKLWDKIRILADILVFDSWEDILTLILNPKKFKAAYLFSQ